MNIQWDNPMLWAIVIGWILTVTLHEFAHGIAAHFGGDYTIAERGGTTLNPLQYIDPVNSIVFPVIFLLLGGIPLPGGANFIRIDLLRNRAWITISYAAGPAMNLLLFFILGIAVHPAVGWVNTQVPVSNWNNAQIFVAAMAMLQLMSVILNLMPIPGNDGFGILSPWLPRDFVDRVTTPQASMICRLGYFVLLWWTPFMGLVIGSMDVFTQTALGFSMDKWMHALRITLYGAA